MKFKILHLTGLLLFLSVWVFAQDPFPTGDEDLTREDVETIKERIYIEPNFDGAIDERPAVDLSKKGNWRLRIRFQGRQQSCQSFAVAYAADILEQNNINHSESFLWDSLTYRRFLDPNDPFRSRYIECATSSDSCLNCQTGSNVVMALRESVSGLPFDSQYNTENLCGTKKPEFDTSASKKFLFKVLWWDEVKQPPELDFPANKYDRQTALEKIREQLSFNKPVLVSICAMGFLGYNNGVHYQNTGNCGKGWHAMTVVGYDNNKVYPGGKGAFKIANSWDSPTGSGTLWGDEGFLWISYPAFAELIRFAAFMNVDLNFNSLSWQPVNINKNLDGTDQELEEESRIGFYQFELNQRASNNTPVCLDANDWFPKNLDPNPVIMYRCQKEQLKTTNNQKWELWLKDQIEDKRYFVLRSQSKFFKGKVLAIRDKKLVLEDESNEFDENQRWLIRFSPNRKGRIIIWAGLQGEFTLQADAVRLLDYSDKTAPEPFILQNFSNLPNQIWLFKPVSVIPEKDTK